jgi:hypothetical protein
MNNTPAITATAHAIHNLGLAAGFGGALFGKLALNPAVRTVRDTSERGEVVNAAWSGFNAVNAWALGSAALTWVAGRMMLSGREVGEGARGLVVAKDLCMATTLGTGLASIACNVYLLRQQQEGGLPIESGGEPSTQTPSRAAKVQKTVNALGMINLITAAGTIALTAWLDTQAGASHRWSLVSRFLP